MTKKVVDIISPKKGKVSVSSKREESKLPKSKFPAPKLNKAGLVFWIVGGVFIIGFLFAFLTLSEARIKVWPKTETVTFDTKVTVDTSAIFVDAELAVIPGEIFSKEKSVAERFISSGEILQESKAQGTITVYNEYSTDPQVLLATTRFVSIEGKLFRTQNKVTIPGGTYVGGKLVPGEIDILVVADESGPEYNIEASTFSIPGFVGTSRYTKFYGRSSVPMTGGFIETRPKITNEDLDKAETAVSKRAKREVEDLLVSVLKTEKQGEGYGYIEKAIETEIIDTMSLARVGEETENFSFQVDAKAKTLIFQQEDLEEIARDFVLSQIPEGKQIYGESLKVNFWPDTTSLDSGKITLSVNVSVKVYADMDLSALKTDLVRKSLLETKIFLENQPGIARTSIEFWPFWVSKVPEDLNKIKLQMEVD